MLFCIVLSIIILGCNTPAKETINTKPRLLVTTDIGGDPDDQQSMVRLLTMANEFDIEGLIASASGTPNELDTAVVKPELILQKIEGYEEVYENLRMHNKDYPSPEILRSLVKAGNPLRGWENIGEGLNTEGSDWIAGKIEADDPRPLNIVIWGGQTDVIQALYQLSQKHEAESFTALIQKVRIYDIADQDFIFPKIRETYPGLFYILNKAPEGIDKREAAFRGMYLGGNMDLTSVEWITSHVLTGHGALGTQYPMKTWTAPNPHSCMKEGDTPSWFYFLNNGLQDPNEPSFGGWGGRFKNSDNRYYQDATDKVDSVSSARVTVWRWREDFQNEFAARMDWCVLPYEEANHHPEARVQNVNSKSILRIQASPGESISLSAAGSSDPDGDNLSYRWWIYPEISTDAELLTPGLEECILKVPDSVSEDQIHVVLEVKDDGEPSLKAYRRVIVEINKLKQNQ